MKVVANTLVKNDERFLWYAVTSVIEHVDKVLLWDTGSTDRTLEIAKELKEIYLDKINLVKASTDLFDEGATRQRMLDHTDCDWLLVVDADEIWWDGSIKKVIDLIYKDGNNLESIVVPTIVPVGDMFHRQEERAGRYTLAGRVGHFNLRAINKKIPGLRSTGAHGVWGWVDKDGKLIQDRDSRKIGFIDSPYFHTTHLQRTSGNKNADVIKRKMKLKYEIGKPFPKDYYYPEVFFRPKPTIVDSPWVNMTLRFKAISFFETPLRKIKRRIWWGKPGY